MALQPRRVPVERNLHLGLTDHSEALKTSHVFQVIWKRDWKTGTGGQLHPSPQFCRDGQLRMAFPKQKGGDSCLAYSQSKNPNWPSQKKSPANLQSRMDWGQCLQTKAFICSISRLKSFASHHCSECPSGQPSGLLLETPLHLHLWAQVDLVSCLPFLGKL